MLDIATTFALFFLACWLAATTLLGAASGWYRLAAAFPDRTERPMLQLRGESGTLGGFVSMRGILRLGACPSGLRIGMLRLFGPFCRDFFIPWESLTVTRKIFLAWPVARLEFGSPPIGTLSIPAESADRLARAALGHWPEAGSFPPASYAEIGRRLLAQWAISTAIAAAFFTLVPLIVAPPGAHPQILVAVLFPATLFGVVFFVRFLWQIRPDAQTSAH